MTCQSNADEADLHSVQPSCVCSVLLSFFLKYSFCLNFLELRINLEVGALGSKVRKKMEKDSHESW